MMTAQTTCKGGLLIDRLKPPENRRWWARNKDGINLFGTLQEMKNLN
jgi:hypothetical protein